MAPTDVYESEVIMAPTDGDWLFTETRSDFSGYCKARDVEDVDNDNETAKSWRAKLIMAHVPPANLDHGVFVKHKTKSSYFFVSNEIESTKKNSSFSIRCEGTFGETPAIFSALLKFRPKVSERLE